MRDQPQPTRSLLDRLTDHAPQLPVEPVQSHPQSLNAVLLSVLRDLENLFNTRSFTASCAPDSGEAARSILAYGSRDFTFANPRSQEMRQRMRLEILRLLTLFEPRLKDAKVRLDPVPGERSLNFRIEAVLQIERLAIPTAFDTRFDVNSGSYSIQT